MELSLLVLLIAALFRDDASKQALNDALAFYREHRAWFTLLAGQKTAAPPDSAQEANAEPADPPAEDALLRILLQRDEA